MTSALNSCVMPGTAAGVPRSPPPSSPFGLPPHGLTPTSRLSARSGQVQLSRRYGGSPSSGSARRRCCRCWRASSAACRPTTTLGPRCTAHDRTKESNSMSVIITGMHRSGTSATARVVDDFGLGAGSEATELAAPDNPRGFFERRDVNDFNDASLSRLGGSWWGAATDHGGYVAPARRARAQCRARTARSLRYRRRAVVLEGPSHDAAAPAGIAWRCGSTP